MKGTAVRDGEPVRWGVLLLLVCLALSSWVQPCPAAEPARTNAVTENIKDLNDKLPRVRESAAINLYNIGAPASAAAPKLISMLSVEPDPQVRNYVVRALGTTGGQSPEAVPPLIKILEQDRDDAIRASAAQALGRIRLQPELTVPALLAALKDRGGEVRSAAAEALGRSGFVAPAEVIALALVTAVYEDKDSRTSAAAALNRMGPKAIAALPTLRRMLVDPDSYKRMLAAEVLARIGREAAVAAPECLAALDDKSVRVRVEAAIALLAMGEQVTPAMAQLVKNLSFDDNLPSTQSLRNAVVPRSAWAVGVYAQHAPGSAASKLALLSVDRDGDVRRSASNSLDQVLAAYVQGHKVGALPALKEAKAMLEASGNRDLSLRAVSIGETIATLEKDAAAQGMSVAADGGVKPHGFRDRLGGAAAAMSAMALACFTAVGILRRRSSSRADQPRGARVLLCYRRQDSASICGRVYDHLLAQFGAANVFRDIDSLAPGDAFAEKIRDYIAQCDAVIVLIGPRWLSMADAAGRRRLDDPEDFVRMEIAEGANQGKLILPALHDGVRMPAAQELPPDMAFLAQRNAIELTDRHFRSDMELLVDAVSRSVGGPSGAARHGPGAGALTSRRLTVGLLALGSLLALAALGAGLMRLTG